MAKSLLDLAYDYISRSKDAVAFKDLWAYVCQESGLDEPTAAKKISPFYTNLKMDGRFVTLGDNTWDLRSRNTFDKTHIDMKDVYSEIDSDMDHDIEEDDEDDKIYEQQEEVNEEESEEDEEKKNEDEVEAL